MSGSLPLPPQIPPDILRELQRTARYRPQTQEFDLPAALAADQRRSTSRQSLPLPPIPPAVVPPQPAGNSAEAGPPRVFPGETAGDTVPARIGAVLPADNPWVSEAIRLAEKYNLPRDVFLSLVYQESGFNPEARSRKGAYGLTQLMPGTAADLKADRYDPAQNLDAGARYLRQQLDRFGSLPLALAAYNAGPNRVARSGNQIPPILETQNYVKKILGRAGVEGYAEGGRVRESLVDMEDRYADEPTIRSADAEYDRRLGERDPFASPVSRMGVANVIPPRGGRAMYPGNAVSPIEAVAGLIPRPEDVQRGMMSAMAGIEIPEGGRVVQTDVTRSGYAIEMPDGRLIDPEGRRGRDVREFAPTVRRSGVLPVGQDVDTGEVSFAAPGALDLLPMAGVQGGPAGTFGAGRGRRPPRGPELPPADVEPNPRAVIGANRPPPPRAPVTPEGFAVKGPEYAKAQQATLREIGQEPAGTGPIDLSQPVNIDSAPQGGLERIVPPRGISSRMQRALENPDVEAGLRESIARGMEMGADKWYHTQPIRDAFIAELGPERGAESFRRYMDYVAATSPRSDVSTNIRNASFYYSRGDEPTVKADLRYPYGHMAQNLHLQNVGTIQSGGFNVLRNPKPASFSENLQGNLEPVTVDTHAFRNIGMRTRDPEFLETSISVPNKTGKAATNLDEEDLALLNMAQRYGEVSEDGKSIIFRPQKLYQEGRLTMDDALQIPSFWASKPRENEYAAAEQLYARIGREFNLRPADTQSAAWSGAGELTGLGSPATRTFPQLFNERVEYTARMRGEDPADTLRMFIRGEKPLLSIGAGALAGTGVAGLADLDEKYAEGGMVRQPIVPASKYDADEVDRIVQEFAQGGAVEAPAEATIGGQDHKLAYITDREAALLKARGGSGRMTRYGVRAYDDSDGDGNNGQGDQGTSDQSTQDAAMSEASTQSAVGGNTGQGAGPTGAGVGTQSTDTGPDAEGQNSEATTQSPAVNTAPFGQAPNAFGLGLMGSIASVATGVPGLGALGTAIGATMDVDALNAQLGMLGLDPNISPTQAIANAMSMGAIGKSAVDQFGQTLGFDALAEAPMSAFSTPDTSIGPSQNPGGSYDRPMYGAEGYGMNYGDGYAKGGLADLSAKYAEGGEVEDDGGVARYDPREIDAIAGEFMAETNPTDLMQRARMMMRGSNVGMPTNIGALDLSDNENASTYANLREMPIEDARFARALRTLNTGINATLDQERGIRLGAGLQAMQDASDRGMSGYGANLSAGYGPVSLQGGYQTSAPGYPGAKPQGVYTYGGNLNIPLDDEGAKALLGAQVMSGRRGSAGMGNAGTLITGGLERPFMGGTLGVDVSADPTLRNKEILFGYRRAF